MLTWTARASGQAYGVQGMIERAKRELIEKDFVTGRSLSAMAKRFYVDTGIPVKADEEFPVYIKEGSHVTGVKVIAEGTGIRDVQRLINTYLLPNGNLTSAKDWYKVRGTAILFDTITGKEYKAEIHWYQCKNIGKVEFKEKRELK